MKQFFEQYGAVVLGILALLVLIAMITPVGNLVKTSLQGTVQTFSTSINSQTDTMTSDMEKAFAQTSQQTYLDENGVLRNGIYEGNLYIDGIKYENLSQIKPNFYDSNGTFNFENHILSAQTVSNSSSYAYIGDITYKVSNFKAHEYQYLYEFEDGYDYIIYASNRTAFSSAFYDRYNEDKISVGPPTYGIGTSSESRYVSTTTNYGRATKGYDEVKYMAIRWATNLHNGQSAISLIGVYKVPSDITIDKNIMQNYDE